MSAYLINGPAVSGKTTVCHELGRQGCHVIDTDEVFAYYGNILTREPVQFPGEYVTEDWYRENGWLWKRDLVKKALVDTEGKSVFFCGGAVNESEFYPWFSNIFFLYIDQVTLKKRLQERGKDLHTNNPIFMKMMLDYIARAEIYVKRYGMILINTSTATVSESALQILGHINKR